MNITHPYGYPFALFMLSGTLFFLIAAFRQFDGYIETRKQRRLDAAASREIRKQFAAHVPPQRSS